MDSANDERARLYKWLARLLVVFIVVVAILAVAWVVLQWSIAQSVYSLKAGLDWFGITFYHDYTFVAAGLFALLLVNPKPGSSDLWRLATVAFTQMRPYEAAERGTRMSEKVNIWLWALWQTLKWAFAFYAFTVSGSFLFLGPIMNPITMMTMGLGSWGDVPRVLALPVAPASGTSFVGLMASMTVHYAVLYYVLSAVVTVVAIRTALQLLANLVTRRSDVWLRNLLTLIALVLLEEILGSPYWLMNIATPYVYGIVWSAFLLTGLGIVYLSRRNATMPRANLFKAIAVLLAAALLVQVAAGAFYFFNWNNNYLPYQWYPQTQKQITVTR